MTKAHIAWEAHTALSSHASHGAAKCPLRYGSNCHGRRRRWWWWWWRWLDNGRWNGVSRRGTYYQSTPRRKNSGNEGWRYNVPHGWMIYLTHWTPFCLFGEHLWGVCFRKTRVVYSGVSKLRWYRLGWRRIRIRGAHGPLQILGW